MCVPERDVAPGISADEYVVFAERQTPNDNREALFLKKDRHELSENKINLSLLPFSPA